MTAQNANFLRVAYLTAVNSPDPSTQLGGVLVSPTGEILGSGWNRFALKLLVTAERLADRDQKYPRTTHAEVAAIWSAIRRGHAHALPDATLYIPWYACENCAITIIESGIRHVVGHRQHPGVSNPHSKWAKAVETGLDMLQEAGVVCEYFDSDEKLGSNPVRFNGELWYP